MELGIVGRTPMHRLPQATGVRRCGGNRQSHRDQHAREQQNEQQSGGQAMHDLHTLFRRSDEKPVLAREPTLSPSADSPGNNLQV
jgi:hypothetical protein